MDYNPEAKMLMIRPEMLSMTFIQQGRGCELVNGKMFSEETQGADERNTVQDQLQRAYNRR